MKIFSFKAVVIWVAAILCILFTTTQVFADMFGFSKKQELVLSAPISGKLISNGKPQVGITVKRSLTYGDEYVDEALTDKDGHFTFDKKVIKTTKPANMFDNDSLIQHLYIEDGTPEGIILWYVIVSKLHDSETLSNLLQQLVCDISEEPETYDIPIKEAPEHFFTIYTTCKI